MLFSDTIFLLLFLPGVLCIYYLIKCVTNKSAIRNLFLLMASIFFYAWGNWNYLYLLLVSVLLNYVLGYLIYLLEKWKKFLLFVTVIINIGILFYFKYQYFVLYNISNLLNQDWNLVQIELPIGISFFTFQAMSYVIDVYRGKVKAQKNPLYLGLYIVLFPQLIAGPIVRYETVDKQIITRNETIDLFADGVCRFMIGLGKKVIISNNLAIIADYVFESNYAEKAVLTFWLGGFAYAMQIYFDFSGYSDMAIGLGKMFGFRFEENFNYPYIAYSVTDFWRRWHISLSSWFRDYVYIPLGGNKCSKGRHIINLFFVWLLTGMWHGANWTFIVWGLAYFVILVVEKYFIRPEQFESKVTRLVYRGDFPLCFIYVDRFPGKQSESGNKLLYINVWGKYHSFL